MQQQNLPRLEQAPHQIYIDNQQRVAQIFNNVGMQQQNLPG